MTDKPQTNQEAQERAELVKLINEIDHVMNWDADHICKCYTEKCSGRAPNCQYHRVEELTREALDKLLARRGEVKTENKK